MTGAAKLLGGAEMVMPGDNVTMEVELGPDRDGREAALRRSRRRQDGRLRRRDEDFGVAKERVEVDAIEMVERQSQWIASAGF